MELCLLTILLPELLVIGLGVIGVVYCLVMNGDLERIYLHYKPPTKHIPTNYWGGYSGGKAPSPRKGPGLELPIISPVRESAKYEPDWTG